MAADKRNFTDFENFPGKINDNDNLYEFPTLYKTASTGKPREWSIFCRLIKEDSKDTKETKKQNWNILAEDEVPLKEEYLEIGYKIPEGTIAQLWSESGLVGNETSRSAATYISIPKNQGKKNERNVLQQALVECRSKYLKKIDDGSVDKLTKLTVDLSGVNINATTKYYPMLAKKYENFEDKIKYPLEGQEKLDGNRCNIFLDSIKKPTYKNVIMYTRSKKDYPHNEPNDNIRKNLLQLLIDNYDKEKCESLFLDGELYNHNVALQDIGSVIRGKALDGETIEYWCYDCFYPSYEEQGFKYRHKVLETAYNKLTLENKNLIKLVKTVEIKSKEENDKFYYDCLSNGYEGIILRNPNGIYLKDPIKKSELLRSKDLLKRKETYSNEFEVVNYSQGSKGKNVGAVLWICEAKNKNKDTFTVDVNWPLKERYEIFKECEKKFDSKYKSRLLTVEYRGLSKTKIPLQAKAIAFRDFM